MRKTALRLAVLVLAAAPACGPRSAPAPESSNPVAAVALKARFRPPADGQLTEAQIESYLRVRRAARGRTDLDAARAIGVDADEYTWTRARVIEALVALDGRKTRAAADETYVRTLAAMRHARESARDRETQKTLSDQIAALERERVETRRQDSLPADIAANVRRVAPRRAEIGALAP